jgi:hypothetical protein
MAITQAVANTFKGQLLQGGAQFYRCDYGKCF